VSYHNGIKLEINSKKYRKYSNTGKLDIIQLNDQLINEEIRWGGIKNPRKK
jgi:hypothetical protein